MQVEEPTMSPLLALPSELIHQILSHLALSDILSAGLVNHALHEHTLQDTLWQPLVQAQVPGSTVPKPASLSWRDLYKQHHPYWFLVKKRIWFADIIHTGKLLIARYDHRINAIEAYALVAERFPPTFQIWDFHSDAIVHSFKPNIQLDLNAPVLRLDAQAYEQATGSIGFRLQKEIPMNIFAGPPGTAGLFSRFMLTRPWPSRITTEATPVWPPLTLPSTQRTRNDAPPSGYMHPSQKPAKLGDQSESTFRIRKWLQFSSRPSELNMRIGEDITTWATLPEECYTPTKKKPWQGIWCGDYAGHGCEFLVIMQPDDPKPLPERAERAQWALRVRGREDSVSSAGSWVTAPTDAVSQSSDDGRDEPQTADDLEDSVSSLQIAYNERQVQQSPEPMEVDEDERVYTGRIEAVKLTGDPNIPRGEYTFIAPDIGPGGLLRVATEDMFKGARIVRSVGHIAARGFRDDDYMTSQLILISHDRLAQYWETFNHVSFYQRVDLDVLSKV